MFSKKITEWRLIVFVLLAFTLVACGGDFNPALDAGVPPVADDGGSGGDDGGGDDGGSGGGGDDGSGSGGDGLIDPSTGTWEKKDEDGDGVADEADDFPFDPSKSSYPLFEEEEFNNNINDANSVNASYPFRILGRIDGDFDIDKFQFSVSSDDVTSQRNLTFVVIKKEINFSPRLTVFDSNGVAVQTFEPKVTAVGNIGASLRFVVKLAGTYYLSITDLNSNNASNYTYIIDAFVDRDADGVDDIVEQALGMNPERLDTDEDSLSDGTEYHVFKTNSLRNSDLDDDSIPNWLDTDSDNDGILDSVEGVINEDSDNLPSFADLDSDNNGIPDGQDFDSVIGSSQDTDNDGLFDFVDTDDDGDRLLDINDAEPKISLLSYDSLQEESPKLSSLQFKKINGEFLFNKVFKGQAVTITGQNILGSAVLVVEREDVSQPVINTVMNFTSSGLVNTSFPYYPENNFGSSPAKAFLVFNGKRTDTVNFEVLDKANPLMLSFSPASASTGGKITIVGRNFSSDSVIVFGGNEIPIEYIDSQNISFIIPEGIASGVFYLKNSHGTTDARFLGVGSSVKVTINAPDNMTELAGPFELADLELNELVNASQHDLSIESQSATTVSLFYPANGSFLLKTLVLPSDSNVEISLETTAIAYALLGMTSGKTEDEINLLIVKLKSLAEYVEFKNYIQAGLLTDIAFLSNNFELGQKINELQTALNRIAGQGKLGLTQINSKSGDQRPNIFPAEDQDDIKVEPTRGGISSLFEYDGFTELQNSTQMYLSAAVYEIIQGQVQTTPAVGLDPSDNNKSKTYSHITSLVDRDMVSPVGFAAFSIAFWSQDHDLDVCPYKDCMIEVITPGDNGTILTGNKAKVRRDLYIRNLIDRAVWPSIKLVAGLILDNLTPADRAKGDVGDDGVVRDFNTAQNAINIVDIVISTMPGMIDAIDDALQDNNITAEEQQDIFNEFKKILEAERDAILSLSPTSGPGPVVTAVFNAAGIDVAKALKIIRDAIIQEIAEGFVPFVGQAIKIIEGLKKVSDLVNLGEAWVDLYTLEQSYNFKVTWGLKILEMSPSIVKAEDNSVELEIKGTGLCPVKKLFLSDLLPKIELTDKITNEKIPLALTQTNYIFTNNCASAKVNIPGSFLKKMQSDSQIVVEITLDDDVANSETQNSQPPFITIGSGLLISEINPSPATTGSQITIKGLGFSKNITEDTVNFVTSSGAKVKADILSATETELVVLIPANAVSGDVEVLVGSLSATKRLEITVNVINIAFGDNGNLLDDSFDLIIDNNAIVTSSQGETRRDVSKSLSAGSHEVKLVGNVVPDNRATYYICFSSNAEIVSGTASAKIDFPVNTQFSQTLTINVKSEVATAPINCAFLNKTTGAVIPLWEE